MDLERSLQAVLVFGIFPLWLAAGGCDWLCHRATRIERTSGSRESVFHLGLFAEVALPALAVLFLRVNALVLLLAALCVLAHFLTSLADTRYAQPRRHISPTEQLVHSFLDVLPLAGLVVLVLLHRDQLVSPDWTPALRTPAPTRAAVILVVGALLLALAMILEEWWRGRRFSDSRADRAAPARPPGAP